MTNHAVQTSTEQLNSIITKNFQLHKNNSVTIADLMIGMWIARTVNLGQLANYSSRAGTMHKDHIYRGYQSLIHKFKLTQEQLATGILKMFGLLANCQILLALDRTNWKYGQEDINLLVLSVVVNGCGIPLFWVELDSKGNSDTEERKNVVNSFINAFGADKINYILADREFIGNEWFDYLSQKQIKFVIRIKANMLVEYNGIVTHSAQLCKDANHANILTFDGKIDRVNLRIQATRSTANELVIVVSNNLSCLALLELYLKRWAIECLFGNLKTKGFNFEDTHFIDKTRISNLTKLIVLAFAIALLLGVIRSINKPIIIKKHGYKQNSYFRYGFDFLITKLLYDLDGAIRIIKLCFSDLTWKQRVDAIQNELYSKGLNPNGK